MNDRLAQQLGVIKTVCEAEIHHPAAEPHQLAEWLRKQADMIEGKPVEFESLQPVRRNLPQ